MLPLVLLSAVCAAAEPIEISSSELTLTVDSQSGDLLALQDLQSGADLLVGAGTPAFQLQLSDADAKQQWVDSRSAESVSADLRQNGPAQTLTLTYSAVADGIDATVVVAARPDSPELRLRIGVTNARDLILETTLFPLLRLRRPLGDSPADDRIFVPGGDGYEARVAEMGENRWHRRGYPGHASMQFSAYYDDAIGLSCICEDTEAGPKLLGASIEDDFVDLSIWLRCPYVAGETYSGPTFCLRRCSGSWMDAADQYRAWAREQWWAKPKTRDAAPPQWVTDSPLVLSAMFRPLGNGEWFVPLERWPEFARIWQEATSATSVMIESRYWEHSGVYTSPFYFPLYPSPEIVKQTLDSVQTEGVHVQAMVAGLRWMIHREPFHTPHYNVLGFDGTQRFEEEGRPVCVVGRDGQVQVNKAYFTWDGDSAIMCPATDFAKEHFRNTARVLAQAGFDLFEFDQMNGGGCPPCYSTEHGHPPGEGPWIHEAIAELMRITREEGRKSNPEFGLSMEDPGELCIPFLDTYISRANHVINWPAAGPGSRVVPAFAYVYHPLITSTNVDIQNTSRPDDFLLLRTARSFAYGAGLSTQLTPWQVMADYGDAGEALFPTPGKMDEAQLTLLRNCVLTHDGPGRPYLTHGEMLRVPELTTPTVRYSVSFNKGTENEAVSLEYPAALNSAWALPDGHTAVFLVNPTRESVTVPFGVMAGEGKADRGAEVSLYVNAKLKGTEPAEALAKIDVPPLSTVMVEMGGPPPER